MIAVLSVLLIVSLSLLFTRMAAVALVHTGLSRETARFQARSAFSGVGFTTSEAEDVVRHPVRRRIVMSLMLIGNVGIVTAAASLMLSFIDSGAPSGFPYELAVMVGGIGVIWAVASSQWADQRIGRAISWALRRWTSLETRDYARLLHLRGDYGVTELQIEAGDWLAARRVGDAGLDHEGLRVLGIECPGGRFIGAPDHDVEVRAGDTLILYGRIARIRELDERALGVAGDARHDGAMAQQRNVSDLERAQARR